MTLGELLQYLQNNTPYPYWEAGENTLQQVKDGTYSNPLVCEVIDSIMKNCQVEESASVLAREQVVKALSTLRLKYMADDAPVEGFRLVEGTVIAIDAAFNDEALRNKA